MDYRAIVVTRLIGRHRLREEILEIEDLEVCWVAPSMLLSRVKAEAVLMLETYSWFGR